MTRSRPNFLVVLADQHRPDFVGYRDEFPVRTPNVDALVEDGVAFENAHCNAPVCAPSRASMWSGLYPHTSGDYDFEHWQEYPLLANTVML